MALDKTEAPRYSKDEKRQKAPFGEGSLAAAPGEKLTSLEKSPHHPFEY